MKTIAICVTFRHKMTGLIYKQKSHVITRKSDVVTIENNNLTSFIRIVQCIRCNCFTILR